MGLTNKNMSLERDCIYGFAGHALEVKGAVKD